MKVWGMGASSRRQRSLVLPSCVLGLQSWTLMPILLAPLRETGAMVSGADEAGSGTEFPTQGGCRWGRPEQPMASVYPQPVSLPQHISGQSGTVGKAEAG